VSLGGAIGNLGMKVVRRLTSVHNPLVRAARRRARSHEQVAILEQAMAVERAIARATRGRGPVIAGPWLAEVGYEALYWLPFLRWVQDRFAVSPDRLVVLSRGGVDHWYRGIAGRYVDIFDCVTAEALTARNDARQREHEGGGRKQSSLAKLDEDLLAAARLQLELGEASVLHPSMLFGLFRDVWQGHLPMDFLWRRTAFTLMDRPPRPSVSGLPDEYVAVKLYTGAALPDTPAHRERLRAMVRTVAERVPVVLLESGSRMDDHADYTFEGLENVTSSRDWMTPRNNLAVQTALIGHARSFVSTCGGLAWLAPFLGVPTVAVYADDRLLAPHLLAARQAARRVGAADFNIIDVGALDRLAPLVDGRPIALPASHS
jgi:hypothetical protein